MFGKLICCDVSITPCTFTKHAPKTFGLILQHVRGLFCKLLPPLPACFKIFPCCLCNANVPFPIFPFQFSQFPFCFPTLVVKPRCECFAPLIGVPWWCHTDFFHYPRCYCFIQDKLFHCCSSLVVRLLFVLHYCSKLVPKFLFFRKRSPGICWFHIVLTVCSFHPLIYYLWPSPVYYMLLISRYGGCLQLCQD